MPQPLDRHLSRNLRVTMVASLLLLSACEQAPRVGARDVQLTQTEPRPEPLTYGLGVAEGTLALEAGCVRLTGGTRGAMTLVFPPDYAAANAGRGVVITSTSGRALYRIGEVAKVGGSPLPGEAAERLLSPETLARCPAPYYLVLPHRESDDRGA